MQNEWSGTSPVLSTDPATPAGQAPDWLRWLASTRPGHPLLTVVRGDGSPGSAISAADWDLRARRIAAWLRAQGQAGDRVLLAHAPGPELLVGLFACFYAGMIAVPAYPPKRTRHGVRLTAILEDCGARLALAEASGWAALRKLAAEDAPWGALRCLDPSTVDGLAPLAVEAVDRPQPDDVAYLQYTSGSTSTPKGVVVTHAALKDNLQLMREAFEGGPDMVMVTWLPLFHDLGLVMGALLPIYCGGRIVLMAPNDFLQRPRLWLEAISRYRGTHSAGPDFAYRLCAERAALDEGPVLDLSSWRVALNGAEPVRAETLQRFQGVFGPCGLQAGVQRPSYGLAEATLVVSTGAWDGGNARPDCGAPYGGRAQIVDPETGRACPDGALGEIWVHGPSVCAGYWRRPELSAEVFAARTAEGQGPCLRTGDLGRMLDGRLVIQGRLKELVILRGQNHHPEDLEDCSRRACGDGAGPAAAFAHESPDGEVLVLVQELPRRSRPLADGLERRIREALAEEHGLRPWTVLLVGPGQVPRTSSGKVQRRACRRAWLDGELRPWNSGAALPAAAAASAVNDGAPADGQAEACMDSLQRAEAAARARRAIDGACNSVPGVERALPVQGEQGPAGEGMRGPLAGPCKDAWRERAHPALASLWAAVRQSDPSSAYHIAWWLRLPAGLDAERLHRALARLAASQPILHAVPVEDAEGLELQARPSPWRVERLADGPLDAASLGAALQAWAQRPFDFERGPLWRVAYAPLAEGGAALAFCFQHLIFDQRSWEAFHGLIDAADQGPLASPDARLMPLPAAASSRAYWARALGGAAPAALVPGRSGRAAHAIAALPEAAVRGLRQAAAGQRATVFAALAAAWGEALARCSGQDDAVFAVPMTLRQQPLSDLRIGYQVHPVPLRIRRRRGDLAAALAQAGRALQEAAENRGVTLAEALRCAGLGGPESFLVYQGAVPASVPLFGQTCDLRTIDCGGLKSALAMEVSGEEGWELKLSYDSSMDEAKAQALLAAFKDVLTEWSGAPVGPAPAIQIGRSAVPDACRTVVEAFHRQVSFRAGSPALLWEGGSLDYGGLAERVRSVARSLDQVGVLPGQRVAVCCPPGPDWVAAVLGCFEAGAVYVPFDPAYPVERLRAMLACAPCTVALVQGDPPAWMAGLPAIDLARAVHARPPYLRRSGQPAPPDPAYVIFTSGSSGRPKGVQVPHRALQNHAIGFAQRLGLGPQDRVLQFVSISFDPSLEELLPALVSGASVVLPQRQGAPAAHELSAWIDRFGVSVAHLPAAYWHAWMEAGGRQALAGHTSLRCLVSGGESPDPRCIEDLLEAGQGRLEHVNAYGPTEACISVSLESRRWGAVQSGPPSLGQPLPGMILALVKGDGRLADAGEEGEIWISGPQLADGHWVDGRLDGSAFCEAALGGLETRRWYRSGDRGQWLPSGRILHRGRIDRQWKLAGIRVEPGEIEAAIRSCPGVAQAVVEARPAADGLEIGAWFCWQGAPAEGAQALRAHLAQRLPAPCIPQRLVELARMPLTPNGKVDRAALWALGSAGAGRRPAAGAGELEALCRAWSECLGRTAGPDSDFFELGGSSLRAIRLAAEAGRILGAPVSVEALLRAGTPRRLLQEARGQGGLGRAWVPMGGQGPGLWLLLPPVSGLLEPYRHLAAVLGERARVFGLDLGVLAPAADPWQGWVEEAARRVEEECGAGPVALAGWSMGGLLAADLARRLAELGRAPRRLALIDAQIPDAVEHALVQGGRDAYEAVFERDRSLAGAGAGADPVGNAAWKDRYTANARAMAAFTPRPIEIPVSLAVSERSSRERPGPSWMAWALLARAGMTSLLLPGDHHSVLEPASSTLLGRRLSVEAWAVGAPPASLEKGGSLC